MTDKHPHASAIDAVGETLIRSHYNLSKRGWQNWRKYGVPRIHWKSLDLLAEVKGKPLPRLGGPAVRYTPALHVEVL